MEGVVPATDSYRAQRDRSVRPPPVTCSHDAFDELCELAIQSFRRLQKRGIILDHHEGGRHVINQYASVAELVFEQKEFNWGKQARCDVVPQHRVGDDWISEDPTDDLSLDTEGL